MSRLELMEKIIKLNEEMKASIEQLTTSDKSKYQKYKTSYNKWLDGKKRKCEICDKEVTYMAFDRHLKSERHLLKEQIKQT